MWAALLSLGFLWGASWLYFTKIPENIRYVADLRAQMPAKQIELLHAERLLRYQRKGVAVVLFFQAPLTLFLWYLVLFR